MGQQQMSTTLEKLAHESRFYACRALLLAYFMQHCHLNEIRDPKVMKCMEALAIADEMKTSAHDPKEPILPVFRGSAKTDVNESAHKFDNAKRKILSFLQEIRQCPH